MTTRIRIERWKEGRLITVMEKEYTYFHINNLLRNKWFSDEVSLAISNKDRITIENVTSESQ